VRRKVDDLFEQRAKCSRSYRKKGGCSAGESSEGAQKEKERLSANRDRLG